MADYMRIESYKNGLILGGLLGLAILFGDKIKQPILDFINNIIPETYQWGGISAMAIVILICAIIGFAVDKT